MPNKLTLVVMAAGLARRYGGTKQLEPVGPSGECLFEYSVFDALRAGIGRVVFVIRPESREAFDSQIAARLARHIDIAYAFQALDSPAIPNRTKPWGTAHALLSAESQTKGHPVVINADDYYGASSFTQAAAFLASEAQAGDSTGAMIGYRLCDTLPPTGQVSRALCSSDELGWLTDIEEIHRIVRLNGKAFRLDRPEHEPIRDDALVSMNFWALPADVFGLLRGRFETFLANSANDLEAEFGLPSAIGDLITDRKIRVRVLPCDEEWFGMTYRNDATEVTHRIRSLVDRGHYPSNLWGGT